MKNKPPASQMRMTIFRANVKDTQVNDIELPEPQRFSRQEAFSLASWAVTHGIPAEDDPSMPARIKDMFGFRAAQHLQQLSKSLANRIGPHVALATKHSLVLELGSDAEGYYFQIVRKRAMAPDLCISNKSAMILLDAMGLIAPLETESREISLVKSRLERSQASCIDHFMGHYHDRLETIVAYGESNGATTISWITFDPAEGTPDLDTIDQSLSLPFSAVR